MTCKEKSIDSTIAGQQGNLLITVMITMVIIALMVSALIQHFIVTEATAVENSLAKVRVYWAMSGHVDYFYSRVAGYKINCTGGTVPTLTEFRDSFNGFNFSSGAHNTCDALCNGSNDSSSTLEIIQCFFNNLETNQTDDTRTWGNYDGNAAYTFDIKHLSGTEAGQIQLKLVNPGTISVLSGLDQYLKPLYVKASIDGTAALHIDQFERF
ncbi:MAG: hypothetical protein HQL84_08585 [Magnetococcales bacterium]|nr:hypothetical protein [Magnetococcales bacterium]MBF0150086.1 hypothetical protein [Magnetococcales bacterium]